MREGMLGTARFAQDKGTHGQYTTSAPPAGAGRGRLLVSCDLTNQWREWAAAEGRGPHAPTSSPGGPGGLPSVRATAGFQ